MNKNILLFFILFCCNHIFAIDIIDLSGSWKVALMLEDSIMVENNVPTNLNLSQNIILPSTLDEAQISPKTNGYVDLQRLSRKNSFAGKAFYQKEIQIPSDWLQDSVILFIERTKPTKIWIDNEYVGGENLISSPQSIMIPRKLKAGSHQLLIMVDNGHHCGLPSNIRSSHMWSEDTQTNWNGLLGHIELQRKGAIRINSIKSYPNIKSNELQFLINIQSDHSGIYTLLIESNGNKAVERCELRLEKGNNKFNINVRLGINYIKWCEYNPTLYRYNFKLLSSKAVQKDEKNIIVGLRNFNKQGKHFLINDLPIYLRGKHDACVFPLTGHPPMSREGWMRYFTVLKEYGFNHVRFHSWCPPEAAFEIADEMGFYLQPELPMWGAMPDSIDNATTQFLYNEAKGILNAYANHPSFVMLSLGNELWGNVEVMQQLVALLRKYDSRPLYALGSNFYLGWKGPQKEEDFIVGCRVGGDDDEHYTPHVRASFSFADAIDGGLLNASYPNTLHDFNRGASYSQVPVVAHETGQYQFYINPKELCKYTGVLTPYNLSTYYKNCVKRHGVEKVEKFFKANGVLSINCYKADIEWSLRSDSLAGFQMLDLQDFPGQGTALIGILDAFMDSKGLIQPSEFKNFNNEVVPLWVSDSYSFEALDSIKGMVKVFNYSPKEIIDAKLSWRLKDKEANILSSGILCADTIYRGLISLGNIEINNNSKIKTQQLMLELTINGTDFRNEYPIWIFAKEKDVDDHKNIKIFQKIDEEIFRYLSQGGKAILIPQQNLYPTSTVGGLFTPDYWNYSMFKTISENAKKPVSPGTLGYLINEENPIFKYFPSESHSDWQWWSIAKLSNPLIMDDLDSGFPIIVEAIDNIERNHTLGVIFECKVGKGSLLICMSDLIKGKSQYRECRALYNALCRYAISKDFNPSNSLSPQSIAKLFNTTYQNDIKGVKNVSYDE